MLNWKELATLSAVCVFGIGSARAEMVLVSSPSQLHCGDFATQESQSVAESSASSVSVAGFDLKYRSASASAQSVNAGHFRDISRIPVQASTGHSSPVCSQSIAAFEYTPGSQGRTDGGHLNWKSVSSRPVAPVSSEIHAISELNGLTQQRMRTVGMGGTEAHAEEPLPLSGLPANVKSSGMPAIGYTALSASLMGLAVGACRRGWLPTFTK